MSTLHLVGLPHTNTTVEYAWCAYTQKVLKFCNMMTARDHEVILYGGPENDGACHEHVVCADDLPSNGEIPHFSADAPLFREFNARAIAAMRELVNPEDLVLLIGGTAQQPIAEAFSANQVVEFGIGYAGVIPSTHWVFESYAWMHTVYGALAGYDASAANGRFFDAVIPNYFDVDDFPYGRGQGGYLLFVGRLIERKGIQIAIDTAERLEMRLVVAGSGDYPLPDWVDYRGVVGPKDRAILMGRAQALIAPTLYLEPFGGVVVEAQMCGTPVITSDWGAFTETVEQGRTGFRCHTLSEFADAVREVWTLDREHVRQRAIDRYALDVVAEQYERYFRRLKTLWGAGFYS